MSDNIRKLKDKASKYYADGKVKDALKLYEQIVADDATEFGCQLKIGDIHRKLGNKAGAVGAYELVAKAYAEDGLLLKSIAVCKMILGVDSRHTTTQTMLADLYSKRRGPAHPGSIPPGARPVVGRPVVGRPPVGRPPTPTRSEAIELPPDDGPMEMTASSHSAARVVETKPAAVPVAPPSVSMAWPVSTQPPTEPQPPSPVASAWPVSGASQGPTSPKVIVGERLEDSVLDITVGNVLTDEESADLERRKKAQAQQLAQQAIDAASAEVRDTTGEIQTLLEELSDDTAQAPTEVPGVTEAPPDQTVQPTEPLPVEAIVGPVRSMPGRPIPPNEETWSGVIKIEDLDKQRIGPTGKVETIPDAPQEEPAPIELTRVKKKAEDEKISISEIEGPAAATLDAAEIPLFSDLPKNAFIQLLVQMEMREMTPGEYVIREGEIDDSFFVIASGKVCVTQKNQSGEQTVLARLSDGAFFGEMALLQDGARTASVVVEEESLIFEISKGVLDDVVSNYPSVASVLRNFYKQRLLSTAMATHPLFRPFSADERRNLMELFKSKTFKVDEVLLPEGKKGSGLYLLLYGELKVIKAGEGGEILLGELGSGDMFGEMSLLTNEPTVASVIAVTDCFVVRLSKKKFDSVIMTHPHVLELVSEVSSARASINEVLLREKRSSSRGGAILV